jgi:hypothetical protein
MYKYFIKIQGLLVNQSYIYSHYLLKFKPKTISILLVKKVWWDKLKKTFMSQYNASLFNIWTFKYRICWYRGSSYHTRYGILYVLTRVYLVTIPYRFQVLRVLLFVIIKVNDIFMRKYGFSTYLPDLF